MSKKKKIYSFIGVIIIVAAVTSGIAIYEKNKTDVRIGYLDGDLHQLAFYVAQEMGFYEDEGLTVSAIAFSNGGSVMSAFETPEATRSIDMAYLGFAPAVYHRFNNPSANVKVLASVNVNGSALIVKDDGSINSSAHLAEKKIAVPALNNMQDFVLSMILAEAGLTHDDLNSTLVMSPADMILALQHGDIDGYVAWEPHCVKGTTAEVGGKYLNKSGDVWENHPCCVVAAHEDFIESDDKTVQKIIKVHNRATQWILDNPNEAKTIAMDKMNLSEAQAIQAMANIGYVYTNDISSMTTFIDKLVNLNDAIDFNSENIPSDVKSSAQFIDYFVDNSYLEALA